jgi:hypothetical protein
VVVFFFIGIFGIESGDKIVWQKDNVACPCGKYGQAKLRMEYEYFHFFFIPLFKWNKRYSLIMGCCGTTYDVPQEEAELIRHQGIINFARLRKRSGFGNWEMSRCPSCGYPADQGFQYCPKCGRRL